MLTRTLSHSPDTHSNTERWLLTYADMITLLAAFFLMLYSMSVMSKGKFAAIASSVRSGFVSPKSDSAAPAAQGGPRQGRAEAAKATGAMLNLRNYVEQHKLGSKVHMRPEERGVVVSLVSDDMLFARGKADLRPGSDELLAQIARVIEAAPNMVSIEGHTDDLPIHTPTFPSNWELSASRAAAVLRGLTERSALPGKRFSASGYADTRPLAANGSDENRAHNRRVDIILLKTDAQREAERQRTVEIRRILAEPDAPQGAAENAPLPSPVHPANADAAPPVTQGAPARGTKNARGGDTTTIEP